MITFYQIFKLIYVIFSINFLHLVSGLNDELIINQISKEIQTIPLEDFSKDTILYKFVDESKNFSTFKLLDRPDSPEYVYKGIDQKSVVVLRTRPLKLTENTSHAVYLVLRSESIPPLKYFAGFAYVRVVNTSEPGAIILGSQAYVLEYGPWDQRDWDTGPRSLVGWPDCKYTIFLPCIGLQLEQELKRRRRRIHPFLNSVSSVFRQKRKVNRIGGLSTLGSGSFFNDLDPSPQLSRSIYTDPDTVKVKVTGTVTTTTYQGRLNILEDLKSGQLDVTDLDPEVLCEVIKDFGPTGVKDGLTLNELVGKHNITIKNTGVMTNLTIGDETFLTDPAEYEVVVIDPSNPENVNLPHELEPIQAQSKAAPSPVLTDSKGKPVASILDSGKSTFIVNVYNPIFNSGSSGNTITNSYNNNKEDDKNKGNGNKSKVTPKPPKPVTKPKPKQPKPTPKMTPKPPNPPPNPIPKATIKPEPKPTPYPETKVPTCPVCPTYPNPYQPNPNPYPPNSYQNPDPTNPKPYPYPPNAYQNPDPTNPKPYPYPPNAYQNPDPTNPKPYPYPPNAYQNPDPTNPKPYPYPHNPYPNPDPTNPNPYPYPHNPYPNPDPTNPNPFPTNPNPYPYNPYQNPDPNNPNPYIYNPYPNPDPNNPNPYPYNPYPNPDPNNPNPDPNNPNPYPTYPFSNPDPTNPNPYNPNPNPYNPNPNTDPTNPNPNPYNPNLNPDPTNPNPYYPNPNVYPPNSNPHHPSNKGNPNTLTPESIHAIRELLKQKAAELCPAHCVCTVRRIDPDPNPGYTPAQAWELITTQGYSRWTSNTIPNGMFGFAYYPPCPPNRRSNSWGKRQVRVKCMPSYFPPPPPPSNTRKWNRFGRAVSGNAHNESHTGTTSNSTRPPRIGIYPGWKPYSLESNNGTLLESMMPFTGLGFCPLEIVTPENITNAKTIEDLLQVLLVVLRTGCQPEAFVKSVQPILADGCFILRNSVVEIPENCKYRTKKKLNIRDFQRLSRAFEMSIFSKVYIANMNATGAHPVNLSIGLISRSVSTLGLAAIQSVNTARSLFPIHAVKLVRNVITTLNTVLNRLLLDVHYIKFQCDSNSTPEAKCNDTLALKEAEALYIFSLEQFFTTGQAFDIPPSRESYLFHSYLKENQKTLRTQLAPFLGQPPRY